MKNSTNSIYNLSNLSCSVLEEAGEILALCLRWLMMSLNYIEEHFMNLVMKGDRMEDELISQITGRETDKYYI